MTRHPQSALAALVLLAALAVGPPARACQCGGAPTVAEGLAKAEWVVEAQVLSVWPVAVHVYGRAGVAQSYRLLILTTWKGSAVAEVVVAGGYTSACDYPLEVGERYLAFISQSSPYDGYPRITFCGATRPMTKLTDKDRAALGSGTPGEPGPPFRPEGPLRRNARRVALVALTTWAAAQSWADLDLDPLARPWIELGVGTLGFLLLGWVSILLARRRFRAALAWTLGPVLVATLACLGWGAILVSTNPWLRDLAR